MHRVVINLASSRRPFTLFTIRYGRLTCAQKPQQSETANRSVVVVPLVVFVH